mmetsp:Transcript_15292/g.42357  ORF Transcript_15292/g.42357 Transcript_15292/m.42357 type:complete len:167 (+) Transcript_15292:405-905(+)
MIFGAILTQKKNTPKNYCSAAVRQFWFAKAPQPNSLFRRDSTFTTTIIKLQEAKKVIVYLSHHPQQQQQHKRVRRKFLSRPLHLRRKSRVHRVVPYSKIPNTKVPILPRSENGSNLASAPIHNMDPFHSDELLHFTGWGTYRCCHTVSRFDGGLSNGSQQTLYQRK